MVRLDDVREIFLIVILLWCGGFLLGYGMTERNLPCLILGLSCCGFVGLWFLRPTGWTGEGAPRSYVVQTWRRRGWLVILRTREHSPVVSQSWSRRRQLRHRVPTFFMKKSSVRSSLIEIEGLRGEGIGSTLESGEIDTNLRLLIMAVVTLEEEIFREIVKYL